MRDLGGGGSWGTPQTPAPFDSSAYAGAAGVTGVPLDPYNGQNPNDLAVNPYGMPSLADQEGPRSTRPEDVDAWVRDHYGHFAAFLDIPDVGRILRKAAIEGWGEGELYGAITQTEWWQNTSAAQRTWTRLTSEDPAEARRLVASKAADIKNRASTLGINVGGIAGLAATAVQNGWTDAQSVDAMLQNINWKTLRAGSLTAARDDVLAIGGDYLVGVSEATARDYAEAIASGEMTQAGVKSAMAKQAKARFGYLSSEIDQGMSVKQYFQPIASQIERELELGSGAVDMMDSKWLSMLEKTGEDGKPRAATLHEATQMARRQPEWANTNKAQTTTTNMMSMISNVFGRNGI